MKFYFLVVCFLIFSCDLPNEADADCSGINMGAAFIDDCGRCVGENTGYEAGYDKDDCDICFGNNSCLNGVCRDESALNYHSSIPEGSIENNSLCVYDICETIPNNVEYDCIDSVINYPYEVGDQLSCSDLEKPFDICFPDTCSDNNISLGDFSGKVIWLEITSSW